MDVIPVLDQIMRIATPALSIVIATRKPVFVIVISTGLVHAVIYGPEHVHATVLSATTTDGVLNVKLMRQ